MEIIYDKTCPLCRLGFLHSLEEHMHYGGAVLLDCEKENPMDDNGDEIHLGDILDCEDGYSVVVVKDDELGLVGKLICEAGNSCEDVPYALNGGRGYTVRKSSGKIG